MAEVQASLLTKREHLQVCWHRRGEASRAVIAGLPRGADGDLNVAAVEHGAPRAAFVCERAKHNRTECAAFVQGSTAVMAASATRRCRGLSSTRAKKPSFGRREAQRPLSVI